MKFHTYATFQSFKLWKSPQLTDMTEGIPEKEMKSLIPVNRFGSPEEVAYAVGFLASPEAAYITGEVLSVNGGMYS